MRVISPIVLLVAGVLAVVGIATALRADPPPPEEETGEEQPAEALDFMPLVVGLRDEMEEHRKRPDEAGPGGELTTAWRLNIQRRAPRLASRAKDLTRSSLWEFDESGERAIRLKPEQWGTAVRRLASLYTELGGAVYGYVQVTVSPERALASWDKRNPPPITTGLTPAGALLQRVRAEIAAHRALGELVPGWLLRELDRLILQERVELEARLEARRRWEEERTRAHEEIRARVEATRALLDLQQARLRSQMEGIRALTAALQETEERRLALALEAFAPEDPVHAATAEPLQAMARGRLAAERFTDRRTSRWGSLLRQQWTVPRAQVLSQIGLAEKRAEKAKAADAGAGAGAGAGGGG